MPALERWFVSPEAVGVNATAEALGHRQHRRGRPELIGARGHRVMADGGLVGLAAAAAVPDRHRNAAASFGDAEAGLILLVEALGRARDSQSFSSFFALS